jgi:hypothetical protein
MRLLIHYFRNKYYLWVFVKSIDFYHMAKYFKDGLIEEKRATNFLNAF